jgi:hypothetical protein
MEDDRGIGGRYAHAIDYKDVIYNGQEYSIGTIAKLNGSLVRFLIDREDKAKMLPRSWHHISSGYIGSTFKVEGARKVLYLHNLVMNRLEFDGKGSTETVDHINGNGLDNRKKNLRIASQSQQNRNTSKRQRTTLKLPAEIDPDSIPTNIYYCAKSKYRGDRFAIEIKGIPGMDDIEWKTTSSKEITTQEKLTQAIAKKHEFIESLPVLKEHVRESELARTLQAEFETIVEMSETV